jgi:omega-hydroxy-beta-dihydromenaquinone-9 sulfotransferase
MPFNFRLFWRMSLRSFHRTANTHGNLTRKRIIFLLLFYTFWPPMLLLTWACFLLDDLIFPAYRKQPIEKPLFILGNFRTGSTFLHRLLWRDAATFTAMRTADIFLMPSITQRRIAHLLGRIDAWVGAPFARLVKRFDDRFLRPIRIHPISLFGPEEDETVLMYIWSSLFVCFLFPFWDELPPYQYFDSAIPKRERDQIMGFYRACVQRHLYAAGGGPCYVSKNPAFTPKIETLLEVFPDARIVYLVRNPLDMLPSTPSWLSYAWHISSDPLEAFPYREQVVELTQHWFEHPLKVLDANPSPHQLIVNFEDLIQHPDRVVHDLYLQLGYPESVELDQMLSDAVSKSRNHQSGHDYNYEAMGFTREEIIQKFAGVFERFGFDQREESPVTEVAGFGSGSGKS